MTLFDYARVAGQFDLENDSQAIRDYKAAWGWERYVGRQYGSTELQLDNGQETVFQSVAAVLAEHIRTLADSEPDPATAAVLRRAAAAIDLPDRHTAEPSTGS